MIQDKYKNNYEKIKVLDITLKPGQIVYIPAYWWYTIKFKEFHQFVSLVIEHLWVLLQFTGFVYAFITTTKCKTDMFEKIDVEKEQEQKISS